jgi:hypothetical protein
MEQSPLTDKEISRLEKSTKRTRNFGWIMATLSLPFVVAIAVTAIQSDFPAVIILSLIGLIFVIIAGNGFIAAARIAADLRGKQASIAAVTVEGKRWTSTKNNAVTSYIIKLDTTEYHVPKLTYDQLETGDRVDIRCTVRSQELLSLKNSKGEYLPLL